MIDIDILKHEIINNIDKYIGNITDETKESIEVEIKKTGTITSYSKHFDCFVKMESRNSEVRKRYLFAKYSDIEEYNNLLKVQKFYKDAGVNPKIPKPLNYFEDSKLLIMEGIKGGNFLLYLLRKLLPGFILFSKADIKHKIRLCASWLAELHNLTYIEDYVSLNDEIELAMIRLKQIPNLDVANNNNLIKNLLESKGESGTIPICLTHRDFSARNIIFVNNKDIVVVDWAQILKKNIYYSIAYFITNLESRKRYFIYSFAPIKSLESLFLEEYKKKTRLHFNISTYNIVKKLYYIEYLYEYYTGTGVFEKWTRTNKRMQNFIGTVVNGLLDWFNEIQI